MPRCLDVGDYLREDGSTEGHRLLTTPVQLLMFKHVHLQCNTL